MAVVCVNVSVFVLRVIFYNKISSQNYLVFVEQEFSFGNCPTLHTKKVMVRLSETLRNWLMPLLQLLTFIDTQGFEGQFVFLPNYVFLLEKKCRKNWGSRPLSPLNIFLAASGKGFGF